MPTKKKLLQYLGRSRSATTAEAKASEPAARRENRGAAHPAPAADVPVSRYDSLTADQVLAHVGELSPTELAKLTEYERRHQNRVAVLAGIESLGSEPWPGYDALDVTGVRSGLDGAGRARLDTVLAYERAHQNRAGVLLAAQQQPGPGTN